MRIATSTGLALSVLLGVTAIPDGPALAKGCPPGLAKKDNGCTPPGLARKEGLPQDHARIGETVDEGYIVLRDPARLGLDPAYRYVRDGDIVYRIDSDTKRILSIIGLLSDLGS